jgi:hypothetical protein
MFWVNSQLSKFMKNAKVTPKIMLVGDFNMLFMCNWSASVISNLYVAIATREATGQSVGHQNIQAMILLDFVQENGLSQVVNIKTREANMLNLIFTNYPSDISNVYCDPNVSMSDHNSVFLSRVSSLSSP